MKIRKVGIPRLTNDNLREVVLRLVESVDELQGAVGTNEQRAVRLGELLRARIARVDPRGELLLQDADTGGTTGESGAVSITGQPGRIAVTAAGQSFVLDLATVTPSVAGALLAITTDTFGRVVATRPVVPGANVSIAPSGDGTSVIISATAGSGPGSNPPINFSYGDASPATIFTVPVDSEVVSVQLQIETPFDGVGAQVRIGTSGLPGRLLDTFHSDPSVAGVYEATPRVQLAAGTQILLTITPGSGASAGTGQIILETLPIS